MIILDQVLHLPMTSNYLLDELEFSKVFGWEGVVRNGYTLSRLSYGETPTHSPSKVPYPGKVPGKIL